jgi:hypothetical protein
MRRVLVPAFTLALAAFAQAAHAQAPDQFDLICHGSAVGAATGFGRGGEIVARFRVDMLHDTFCVDACSKLMPISAIAGDEVQVQVEDAAYTLMPDAKQFAYRSEAEDEAFGGGGCEVAPFSGFPTR